MAYAWKRFVTPRVGKVLKMEKDNAEAQRRRERWDARRVSGKTRVMMRLR
jgi:hypothetical protein